MGADLYQVFVLPTGKEPVEFDTRDGLDITFSIDGGNIDVADTVELWVAYQSAS